MLPVKAKYPLTVLTFDLGEPILYLYSNCLSEIKSVNVFKPSEDLIMKTGVLIVEEYSANLPLLKDATPNTERFEFHFITHFTEALTLIHQENIKPQIIFSDYICHHFVDGQRKLFFDLTSGARKVLPGIKIVMLFPQNMMKDCCCSPEATGKCWEYSFTKPTRIELIYEIIDAVL